MRRRNHVDVVRHEAIRLHANPMVESVLPKQVEIKPPVGVAKKHLLAIVAAMADVMRQAGNHDSLGIRHNNIVQTSSKNSQPSESIITDAPNFLLIF